jgi:hypothetical protein
MLPYQIASPWLGISVRHGNARLRCLPCSGGDCRVSAKRSVRADDPLGHAGSVQRAPAGGLSPSEVLERRRRERDFLQWRQSCGAVETGFGPKRLRLHGRPASFFDICKTIVSGGEKSLSTRSHISKCPRNIRQARRLPMTRCASQCGVAMNRLSIDWDERAGHCSESKSQAAEPPAAPPDRYD